LSDFRGPFHNDLQSKRGRGEGNVGVRAFPLNIRVFRSRYLL
jgi:hypothetical protein